MRGAKKPVGAMETTGARPAVMVTITAVIAVLPLMVWRTWLERGEGWAEGWATVGRRLGLG